MKIIIMLTLLISTAQPLYASLETTSFCKKYPLDQKRITEVKKEGWIVQQSDEKSHVKEYRYGCLDLKWRTELYENLCLNKNNDINLPKAIIFYFDGFGYFRPKEAKSEFTAVNLTGDEPAGMLPNGIIALQKYIGKINSHNSSSVNWRRDIQFHYHSGSGTDAIQGIENAQACYSAILDDFKIIEENYPELNLPKQIIMGHSNGGASAINFVNHFTKSTNSFFDLLITIDPVPKTGSFIFNKIFAKESSFSLDKSENITSSFNFYQRSNTPIMAGVISIKGSRVEGAQYEREIDANHVSILVNSLVTETIANEVVSSIKR